MIIRALEVGAGLEFGALVVLLVQLWRRLRLLPRRLPPMEPPAPRQLGLMRPAEFGPLFQPLEVVERVRTAVFRDQMKALAGRFAQRAEDWQNEFVERWGEHWSHDYVAWLTA